MRQHPDGSRDGPDSGTTGVAPGAFSDGNISGALDGGKSPFGSEGRIVDSNTSKEGNGGVGSVLGSDGSVRAREAPSDKDGESVPGRSSVSGRKSQIGVDGAKGIGRGQQIPAGKVWL